MYNLLEKADKLTDIGKGNEALKILQEIRDSANMDFLDENGAKIAECFGAAFTVLGNAEKAAAAYLDAAGKDEFLRAERGHIASYLFILHYLSNINTSELYDQLIRFEDFFADISPFDKIKYSHKKIKIGYLLPKTTKSSVSNFIAPMLTKYNRDEFETYVYTFSEKSDEFTKEVKESATSYKILNIVSYYDAAKTIRDEEIDILMDTAAFGAGADTLSILAYRPAPIQIVGVGWPSIAHLTFIDYILADDFLIDGKMGDIPLTLKNALCFRPDRDMFQNLRNKKNASNIAFGVFNNFMKITDDMLLVWKEILDNAPTATLTLQDSSIYGERADAMRLRLQKLGFKDRVNVKTASENYLYDIANTDIVLDTYPYTGGFMTATAITLGTPVITLAGARFSSKFSADILRIANLKEFIAHNADEYRDIAARLANNIPQNLRDGIRSRVLKSELVSEKDYMQNLEYAYKNIQGNL